MNPMPAPSLAYKPPCPGKTPVRAPSAYEEWGTNPNECSGNWPTKVYIEDTIKIPTDIPVRTYVFNVFFSQPKTAREPAGMYRSCECVRTSD